MADIRNQENQSFGQQCPNSPLARARASSSDRASDLLVAQIGAKAVAENVAANAARRWAVTVFGREHNQRFSELEHAQDTANKIGGQVVDTWL